jgi:Copper chaperone
MNTVAKGAVTESGELRLKISGMHCKACVEHVSQALKKLDGVEAVSVSLMPPEAVLKTARMLSLSEINHALAQVGEYRASEHFGDTSPAPMFQIELPVSAAAAVPQVSQREFWQDASTWRRASLNTLNCLVGCSIGDFGFIIYAQATALAWSMWAIMGVAMLCGLSTSVLMETLLLKWRENFGWKMAVRTAFP